jgi:hypothetical protein
LLKGRVIFGYVGHVKSMHAKVAYGQAFACVVDATGRLQSMSKVLQQWRPAGAVLKVAFTVVHFEIFSATVDVLKSRTCCSNTRFMLDRVRMAVAVMLTAVLRSSEIVDNQYMSAANRSPIWMADVQFANGLGDRARTLERGHDGTVPAGSDYATTKMPPSKADPVQRAGNELFFPGRLPESKVNGAKECIENWFNDYPVHPELQHVTPLFRTVRTGTPTQFTRATFLNDFKWVCRQALECTGTELRYSQWGTHAFRVGGMNALQDAGASVAEIMALGHWRSDAWLAYSRRSRPRLMYWSRQILGPTAAARAILADGSSSAMVASDPEWEDDAQDLD